MGLIAVGLAGFHYCGELFSRLGRVDVAVSTSCRSRVCAYALLRFCASRVCGFAWVRPRIAEGSFSQTAGSRFSQVPPLRCYALWLPIGLGEAVGCDL